MDILGYQAKDVIYESDNSLVYRAQRKTDGQSVILKMLKQAYPPPKRIAEFQREYQITKNLTMTGVVDAYSLETDQNRWVIVLEDFGGESLARIKQNHQFNLNEFLSLAIKIVDILGQVHEQHITHKDINPSNIVWNQKTDEIKLIDFGISTLLSRENSTFCNPNLLEGTLAYISPEQTGRMNRVIDYRTDFYSLGVSFYELLTNQLPFNSHDLLELIHCHIARQPVPLHQHKADIPIVISDIVLKLMAKNAEDRYQSGFGLKADLEESLRQWQTLGEVTSFPLGQHDISGRLQIPQKLYGRKVEIETLLAAFERASKGACEMMLVAGYSGIGKSALVQEVYKPITQQKGYFTSGKFDQFQRDIPYSSLIQALRSLIRQLLTESQKRVKSWREKLLVALGSNGQVIIDVIPEVELIIGKQSAVPILAPTESQNRFNLVFQNFIRVFAQASHPLVIFLDDLQWSDGASLKLLELLMTAEDNHYLLLIGAYRDHEVGATHPLLLTIDEIRKGKATVNQIVLTTLTQIEVNQFTADALNCSPEKAKFLSELLLSKTHGNPFFTNEFLKSLYAEELLIFDFQQGIWQWDLETIQTRDITDNVVELMTEQLRKLEAQTQQVLKLAACIGNQFSLQNLAVIYEKSFQVTAADLWSAIAAGLVLPLGDNYKLIDFDIQGLADEVKVEYKFAHDRIQQAAYSLIPQAENQIVHWQVGQLLLQNTSMEEREQKIFDIVNQLNQGRERLEHQTQLNELAQLNLIAGQKAKASAAYQPAFNYLQMGIRLLNFPDSWEQQYDLTLNLYLEAAEVASLIGQLEEVEEWTQTILQKATSTPNQVKAYQIKLQAYLARQQSSEAIAFGLQALKFLGIDFPENPSQEYLELRLRETKAIWDDQNIQDLINLPEMTDAMKQASMPLLLLILTLGSIGLPESYYRLIIVELVSLSLKFGNSPCSAIAYTCYGYALCATGEIAAGYQFGQLALSLLERLNNTRQFETVTIHAFNTFVRPWKEHIQATLKPLIQAHHIGIETGDINYSAFAIFSYVFNAYWIGRELVDLELEIVNFSNVIRKYTQEVALRWIELVRQPILVLVGRTKNPFSFVSENYNEEVMLTFYREINDVQSIHFLYLHKLVICYLFQDYQEAIKNANHAEDIMSVALGSYSWVILLFYSSLSQLAVFSDVEKEEQVIILDKVTANQQKIQAWAYHAPMNFLHKFYLIEAECDRVLGKYQDARENYDRAITLAHENEYLNEEALAYELAGKFYLTTNQKHVARHYLQDAHYTYQRWGAMAKVKDLETRYPQFLANTSTNHFPIRLNTSTTNSNKTTSGELDFSSVLKASQTISGEIVLDKLLEKLMKIVIENAGAQRGFLILHKENNLVIEAEGTVDSNHVTVLQSLPLDSVNPDNQTPLLSTAIVNYVVRTQENAVLNDATYEGQFTHDPYIITTKPKSILCTPLIHQGKLSGILYLENNLTTGTFTSDRVEVLKILSAQAAISIDNSRLYDELEGYSRTLEQKVETRTQELQQTNQELASILQTLKATQAQIIAQEKLASLGALTAGIAHEIKNPLNFVNNFAELSVELTQELAEEIENQKHLLDPENKEYITDILNDIKQNAEKIHEHGTRADGIVHAMLMHSRGQTGDRQLTDINALLSEAIELAYHGMRAKNDSFNINIEKDYDHNLSQMNIVPQNISRAFINIINNACYATYKKKIRFQTQLERKNQEFVPTLSVSTKDLGKEVEIRIRDNGQGISQELLGKIFNPFFTTKPAGEGTGLGLSITNDIIVQQHQGGIRVETEVDIYTEFIVILPKTK